MNLVCYLSVTRCILLYKYPACLSSEAPIVWSDRQVKKWGGAFLCGDVSVVWNSVIHTSALSYLYLMSTPWGVLDFLSRLCLNVASTQKTISHFLLVVSFSKIFLHIFLSAWVNRIENRENKFLILGFNF